MYTNEIATPCKYAVFCTDIYVRAELLIGSEEYTIEDGQNTTYFVGFFGNDNSTADEAIDEALQEILDDIDEELDDETKDEIRENLAVFQIK